MNKNGFTLTEILVVIVIIALLTAIAIPSIIAINNRINERLYNDKKTLILSAAKQYGRDNEQLFSSTSTVNITVETLIANKNIDIDVKNGVGNCSSSVGCLIDPRDKESLNNKTITLEKINQSIVAQMEE